MIKGQELVNMTEAMRKVGANTSDIAKACGYYSIRENGSEKVDYTEYYTELLTAQGIISPVDDDDFEGSDDPTVQDLINNGHSSDAIRVFIEQYGVECIEHFVDSYQGEFASGAEFAEYITNELNDLRNFPADVVIDWDSTWSEYLYYQYDFVEGYIFRNDF